MHMYPALGGGLVLVGLGVVITGFKLAWDSGSNFRHRIWLYVLGAILMTKGMFMLGVL